MKILVAGLTTGGDACEHALDLPEGTRAAEAAEAACRAFGFEDGGEGCLAVWGLRVPAERMLRAGDRLEITPPLLISANEARKLRAKRAQEVQQLSRGRHGGKHRLA